MRNANPQPISEPSDTQMLFAALVAMAERIETLETRTAKLVNRVSYLEGAHNP